MQYLGGKCRQSKAIVQAVVDLYPNFSCYVEPFCGAMWSACAMIRRFPDRKFYLNDANPYLMEFWRAAIEDGWDPPQAMSEGDYLDLKRELKVTPLTGWAGFAMSFAGKFMDTPARRKGVFFGEHDKWRLAAYNGTMRKLEVLRPANVSISVQDYRRVPIPTGSVVYLDPPYMSRSVQSKVTSIDECEYYYEYAERAASRAALVLASEFVNPMGWPVVHNWGDTVVRHYAGKPPDGTEELLMRVPKPVRRASRACGD